jgi:hypothetical protein
MFRQWLKRSLVIAFILAVFAWIPMLAMGATWVRDVGLLSSDAIIFPSDSPTVDRVMASVFRGIYGSRVAVCNAVDDHLEISAAITAGAESICLAKGNFYGEDIDFGSNPVNLYGQGVFATYYHLEANTDDYAIKATSANYHSTIKDMSIDGNAPNQSSGGGINLNNFMATIIENIRVSLAKQYGLYASGSTEYVTLQNVVSYDCGYGMYLSGIQWYDILQSNATQNTTALSSGMFISGVDVLLEGCVADMATASVDVAAGFTFYNSSRITALHCRAFGDPAASNLLRGFQAYSDAGDSKAIRWMALEAHNTDAVTGQPVYHIQTAAAATIEISVSDCIHTGTGSPGFGDTNSIAGSVKAEIARNTSSAATPFSFTRSITSFQDNYDYIAPGEIRTASSTLLATGSTLTDGTGTFTGSVITLKPGANTVVCSAAGTATIVLPTGCTGTAATGTMTVDASPVALVAGSNVITTSGATGNIVVTINHFAAAWHCPELQDILIKKITVEITTPGGTATSVIQCGIADDAIGTNLASEFFTGLNNNAAAVRDSWLAGDTGAQTKYIVLQDSASATDGWINFKTNTEIAQALVARYYIEYVGR